MQAPTTNPADVALQLTTIFLTPSGVLVAALGAARTEGLKTGVSLLGAAVSVIWFFCDVSALSQEAATINWYHKLVVALPAFFFSIWAISGYVHARERARIEATRPHKTFGRRRVTASIHVTPAPENSAFAHTLHWAISVNEVPQPGWLVPIGLSEFELWSEVERELARRTERNELVGWTGRLRLRDMVRIG
jgi:hypothetical protein